MTATGTRVVFPERGRVALETFDLPDVGPEQVLFRTRFSLVSSGTERIVLHGRFDSNTHWTGYAQYPFHPGYAAVGEVVAAGQDVRDVAVGDIVAARLGHGSLHVTDARACAPIPPGVDLQQATWFAPAKITRSNRAPAALTALANDFAPGGLTTGGLS